MSDPVTNVEIEDVLSSIRRLVSENARHDMRGLSGGSARETTPKLPADRLVDGAAAQPGRAGKVEPGLLLLTPAHRIEDEAEAEPPMDEVHDDGPETAHHWADDGAEAAPDEAEASAAPSAAELEALAGIVGLEAAVSDAVNAALDDVLGDADGAPTQQAGDEAGLEPERLGDVAWDADDLSGVVRTEAEMAEAPIEEETGTEAVFSSLRFAHAAPQPGTEAEVQPGELSSLASRIAGLEAAVAESADDEWEPDGTGEGDNAGAPVDALNWEDAEAADGVDHAWEADPLDEVEEADLAEPEPTATVEVDAEPELAADPTIEPIPADDATDPQPAREFAPKDDFFVEAESVIDEDMLRDLVSDIVRRELQGSLGERITRNVRKLVRREIHRALSARDLD